MGGRTGIGLVECAILEALDSSGARPRRGFVGNARVLAKVEESTGLAPGYTYEVLLDLARPWTMPVSLVSFHGNFGRRGGPAANFRYTESRLSPTGQVALAAERGDIAPVPIGLINGNAYRQGTRPPFRPQAVLEALRQVIRRPRTASRDLDIVGPPAFGNDCTVTGDFAALAAGRRVMLRLQATLTVSEERGGSVVIAHFPPDADPDETVASIASRARTRDWSPRYPVLHRSARLPVREVRDESSMAGNTDRVVCVPEPGTTPEQLRDQLLEVYGVYTTIEVALPRPLGAMIRGWTTLYRSEDLAGSLAALEIALV